jgi:hypothetical protein
MALAIAAEAAALGRPNEARRQATKALERVVGGVDALLRGCHAQGLAGRRRRAAANRRHAVPQKPRPRSTCVPVKPTPP